ncbi:SigE family RNA polymerase sigma factor [Fodinicola acaciae]|uniref:SigE family RNA polymerase sigma factor n=1 Tax=Fodinicola acaciae TaxID=2681555 RepID=UPI0013D1A38D|nr:SigE family RNA polymerase sigma factor [Fodinicola acaciae]
MDAAAKQRFAEFVAARTPALMRLAYLLTGDQHAAEDLLQTALTKAMVRWRTLQRDDPEAYVRRVMYHEQVSWWRRAARRRETTVHELPDTPLADPSDQSDLRMQTRQALLRLTAKQRAVLVLRYFEDLSETQVADALGCSVGTVRSQTAKAVARLRQLAPELARMTTFEEVTP